MKFNRQHLEELTLQKIKEVNDEAGYRKYLEVPEMVNIVASIIEEMLKEPYAYSNIKMEENKTYAYSSQTCMKCNSVFVYYDDGWHCNCETSESLQQANTHTIFAVELFDGRWKTNESFVSLQVAQTYYDHMKMKEWNVCSEIRIVEQVVKVLSVDNLKRSRDLGMI